MDAMKTSMLLTCMTCATPSSFNCTAAYLGNMVGFDLEDVSAMQITSASHQVSRVHHGYDHDITDTVMPPMTNIKTTKTRIYQIFFLQTFAVNSPLLAPA